MTQLRAPRGAGRATAARRRVLPAEASEPLGALQVGDVTGVAALATAPGRSLLPDAVRLAAQAGKFEQSCPTCGRWEAAGYACSFCGRPVDPAEWYRNDDIERRYRDLPARPPKDVPPEYLAAEKWPPQWGPYPYRQEPARGRSTRVNRAPTRGSRVSGPVTPESASPSTTHTASATAYDGTLGLV